LFDIEKLLDDLGISNTSSGKHARPGWVQVECPLCTGNPGWHGGFNTTRGYYNCWRCGWHTVEDVLMAMTSQRFPQIKKLLRAYTTDWIEEDEPDDPHASVHMVEFPLGTGPLQEHHKKYLEERNLEPKKIEEEWGVLGTGALGDYKFRIIAPVHHQDRIVSYQSRDITGRSALPYKACPKSNEVIHHKHLIYGIDKVTTNRLLVVEGIFDVWNIGPGAVATFGIDYTREQITILERFRGHIFIMYDAKEEKAHEQAEQLHWRLEESEVMELSHGDPGEMPRNTVLSLRKYLGI
jgi:hypothetical protein